MAPAWFAIRDIPWKLHRPSPRKSGLCGTCCSRPEQARIVRLLVERVDLAPDGMQVRLRAEGLQTLVEELQVAGG